MHWKGSRLGDVSINTSSLAALPPFLQWAEGYGVSFSCCGNLGCHLRSGWSIKAQSFILTQLSSQCSPRQKTSKSVAFHIVCALRRWFPRSSLLFLQLWKHSQYILYVEMIICSTHTPTRLLFSSFAFVWIVTRDRWHILTKVFRLEDAGSKILECFENVYWTFLFHHLGEERRYSYFEIESC